MTEWTSINGSTSTWDSYTPTFHSTASTILDTASYDTFSDALAAIGSDNRTLYVTTDVTISSTTTVSTNVSVVVNLGGSICQNAPVTFNGPFTAPLAQVFTGTGAVTFGTTGISIVHPEWWGNDIQKAINSLSGVGGFVQLQQNKSYAITSTLSMKRGVYIGSPVASWDVGHIVGNTDMLGMPRITSSGLADNAIEFDFSAALNESDRPWNAGLIGVSIDCTGQTAGSGIVFVTPVAGSGPASNGLIYAGLILKNIIVNNAYTYGIHVQSNVNGTMFERIAVTSSGSHGILLENRDPQIMLAFSWSNTGSGLYNKTTAGRIYHSDFWSNGADGITDEGYGNTYTRCQTDNNDQHGFNIAEGTTIASASRIISVNQLKSFANSNGTDNTYADFYIDSYGGAGITGTRITNSELSTSSSNSNKPYAAIDIAAAPSGRNAIGDCHLSTAGLAVGGVSATDLVRQYFMIRNVFTGSNFIGNIPISISDGNTTPNVALSDFYKTANTSPTTITNFLGGKSGQTVTIYFEDANTTIDFTGTNLKGNGGADWTATAGDSMICRSIDGTTWACVIA